MSKQNNKLKIFLIGYKSFLQQNLYEYLKKKYLVKKIRFENFKKYTKDHLRQLEEFELSKLTLMLNSTFSNVEQLCYKCDICNSFVGKSKRALTTHKNKCKKLHSQIVPKNDAENNLVNLD